MMDQDGASRGQVHTQGQFRSLLPSALFRALQEGKGLPPLQPLDEWAFLPSSGLYVEPSHRRVRIQAALDALAVGMPVICVVPEGHGCTTLNRRLAVLAATHGARHVRAQVVNLSIEDFVDNERSPAGIVQERFPRQVSPGQRVRLQVDASRGPTRPDDRLYFEAAQQLVIGVAAFRHRTASNGIVAQESWVLPRPLRADEALGEVEIMQGSRFPSPIFSSLPDESRRMRIAFPWYMPSELIAIVAGHLGSTNAERSTLASAMEDAIGPNVWSAALRSAEPATEVLRGLEQELSRSFADVVTLANG